MRTERRCTTHDLPKVAREGTHFFLPEPGEPDCVWEDVYVIPVDKVDVTFVPESEEVSIRGIVGKRVLVVDDD